MDNINDELFNRQLITDQQYGFLEAIRTNKIVSVNIELRLMLYLGILLFTGGVGYFAYQNIGEMGHLLMMTIMGALIFAGFYFLRKFAKPYSNDEVTVNHGYFDYILILVALLVIGLFSYFQVYFNLVELLLNWTSFISAILFLFMAYRYDSRPLLAMAITVFAAAVGISVSPIDWVKGDLLRISDLYMTSIILGLVLVVVGHLSQSKNVKKHFRFTYQNFGLLLYFIGCLCAVFDSHYPTLFALLTLLSGGAITYLSWKHKAFLFLIYANIAFYIAVTYLLFRALDGFDEAYVLFIYYFPITSIGYVIFLFNKKSHFAHE